MDKAITSKTFCIMPWVHQYVGPHGDVKPCCIYQSDLKIGDLKQLTLKEIWNNDATKQMRIDMLNGVTLAGCKICDSREHLTKSFKAELNKKMFVNNEPNMKLVANTHEDGRLDVYQLQYLDIRFNNLCNLKCRTCGPTFSSSWVEDHAKLNNFLPEDRKINNVGFAFSGKTKDQALAEILPHLPYVKWIYFAGGEPLMQKEHYTVLNELIRLGRNSDPTLDIFYNTNFSVLKLGKQSVIDLWKQFRRIRIGASIDGSYAKAEYWRKGTVWSELVDNVRRYKTECPNGEFYISYTLSWVNAFNMIELHREWVAENLIKVDNFNVGILDSPSCYSLKSIPTWKKDKIKTEFEAHISWMLSEGATESTVDNFRDSITFMYDFDTGDKFIKAIEFKNLNGKLDEMRNEDFWAVFPEHADMKVFNV